MKCKFCLEEIAASSEVCKYCGKQLNSDKSEKFQERDYLEAAFRRIDKKIDELLLKKDEIKGLIFKRHKYTAEELLNSPEYDRIKSLIEKINDDITNWKNSNRLSLSTRNIYNTNRDLLETRLIDTENKIRNREPTWWENVKRFFTKFIQFVIEKLPKLWNGLMLAANALQNKEGLIGNIAKTLIGVDKKIRKFILGKKNQFIKDV